MRRPQHCRRTHSVAASTWTPMGPSLRDAAFDRPHRVEGLQARGQRPSPHSTRDASRGDRRQQPTSASRLRETAAAQHHHRALRTRQTRSNREKRGRPRCRPHPDPRASPAQAPSDDRSPQWAARSITLPFADARLGRPLPRAARSITLPLIEKTIA